jgi:hypothetical protein
MASTAARPWATKTAPMPSNPPAKKRVVDTAGYRGVPVASKAARVRARPSDPAVARAQLQDGLVIGQGAGEVALTLAAAPATGEGVGIPRVEPDRLVEIGDRPVVLAPGAIGGAAVAEGLSKLRVEPDGLVEVGDRPIELALMEVGVTAADEGLGESTARR